MRDVVLFDLDNTLFDVEQYMHGAFTDVAAYLAGEYDCSREEIRTDLLDLWRAETSMYSTLFDDVVAAHELDADIGRLVKIFNDHEPEIEPYEGVPTLLDRLRETGYTLGVVTDGTARRQRRKLDALGLQTAFETVVLTDEIEKPKPSPVSFEEATRRLDRGGEECIYVGDNPRVDFSGAKEVGMYTIRLTRGEFQHLPSGPAVDTSVEDVDSIYDVVSDTRY